MTKNQRQLFVYILFLGSIGYIATEIYLPSLPSIESYLNTTESLVQLTIFSYLVSFSCAPIFFGPLADMVGRKKVVMIGLAIGTLATLCCTYAPNIHLLIAARFVQGLGFGATVVAARSMIPDVFSGKELNQVSSYFAMTIPILVAISPVIGGFIEHWAIWRYVFGLLTLYSIGVFLSCLPLKETHKTKNSHSYMTTLKCYKTLLCNPAFMSYAALVIIPMIGFMGFLTAAPFLFQNLVGLSPAEFGLLSIVSSGMIVIAGFTNSRLINILQPESMLCIAMGLMMSAGVSILLGVYFDWPLFWVVLIPSCMNIIATPLTYANSSHRAFGFISEHFGLASAMFTSFQFLGAIIGSLLFAILEEQGVMPLGICYLTCSLVMLALLIFAMRCRQHLHEKPVPL